MAADKGGSGSSTVGESQPRGSEEAEGLLTKTDEISPDSQSGKDFVTIEELENLQENGTIRISSSGKESDSDDSSTPFQCRICSSSGIDILGQEVQDCPCDCKGDLGKAHPNCLAFWVRESKSTRCEICLHQYENLDVERAQLPENFTRSTPEVVSLQQQGVPEEFREQSRRAVEQTFSLLRLQLAQHRAPSRRLKHTVFVTVALLVVLMCISIGISVTSGAEYSRMRSEPYADKNTLIDLNVFYAVFFCISFFAGTVAAIIAIAWVAKESWRIRRRRTLYMAAQRRLQEIFDTFGPVEQEHFV